MESNQTPIASRRTDKKVGKKRGLIVGIALALVAVVALIVLACSASGNTYKTPVALAAEQANDRTYKNDVDLHYRALNGFAEKEAAAVMELVANSDGYQAALEEEKWFFDEAVGFNKKAYGDDWQLRYKIAAVEKLDEAALERYKASLSRYGQELESALAADSALNRSLLAYAEQLKSAEVTGGYALTVKKVMTGSNLAQPEVEEEPITVYKVNGRWLIEEKPIAFATEALRYATKG